MRHATCAACPSCTTREPHEPGLETARKKEKARNRRESEKEEAGNKGKIYTYIATITPTTGSRAALHIAWTKIYREHFAWSSERGSPTLAETSCPRATTITTITLYMVVRATVINHATGMIRLNCCSHVSALETAPRSFSSCAVDCSPRPHRKAAGYEGWVPRKPFVPCLQREEPPPGTAARRKRQCPSSALSTHASK